MVLLMEIFEGITVCYLSQLLKFVIKKMEKEIGIEG